MTSNESPKDDKADEITKEQIEKLAHVLAEEVVSELDLPAMRQRADKALMEIEKGETGIETARDKYIYFLLAAAGAAIAYAMERSRDIVFSPKDGILAGAVACYVGSFIAGCINRRRDITLAEQRVMGQGITTIFEMSPEALALEKLQQHDAKQMIEQLVAKNHSLQRAIQQEARFLFSAQFNLLILGACIFAIWHVWGIVLATELKASQERIPSIRQPTIEPKPQLDAPRQLRTRNSARNSS